jgi:hypothetical protein
VPAREKAIQKRVWWQTLSVCVFALLFLSSNAAIGLTEAAPSPDTTLVSQSPPNCRFGAAVSPSFGADQVPWLSQLGAGWYLDFSSHPPYASTDAEFVQVVRVRQKKVNCDYVAGYDTWPALTETGLGSVIASNRGALWIIGNEPDRGPNPDQCWLRGQDDTMPEVYAQIYHDVYAFIKKHDPAARVANAGLVEVTPGRLQYLDKVWQAYLNRYGSPMPVDVWNFHLYILPEAYANGQPNGIANVALGTDPALAIRESNGDSATCSDPKVYCYAEHDDMIAFAGQVVALRTWMKQHGQQSKPLILTEYSILYPYQIDPEGCYLQDEYGRCFTPDRVRNFMTRSFDYLDSAADPTLGYPADDYRLVQRWLWFSTFISTDQLFPGYVSNLLTDAQTAFTTVGELFQSSVAGRPTTVNLRPDSVPPLSAYAQAGIATASIRITVHNAGTTSTASPFTVTFYSDSALTQPIGSVIIDSGLKGCEASRKTATVSWPDLPIGSYPFWAKVDSGGAIAESDETDNVISGVVTVLPVRQYLPLAFRS